MRVLVIGDAVAATGFARVTHNICDRLSGEVEVCVFGINFYGDPHKYGYRIWPAMGPTSNGDLFGRERIRPLCEALRPDVVLVINDPWNVAELMKEVPPGVPVVAYMPVDGANQQAAEQLNGLAYAIAYTEFGKRELTLGGFRGRCVVIPHGCDTSVYFPVDKMAARRRINLKAARERPESLYIVGNVNRNQPRKRLDLTVQAFTQFWHETGQRREVLLYLHCSNRDIGYDLLKLARYYGVFDQVVLTSNDLKQTGIKEADMRLVYGMLDVQVSTSVGEGWGLTTHEGMACGIPQVVPRSSALAEWADGAVRYAEIGGYAVTPGGANVVCAVPDVESVVAGLVDLYAHPEERERLAAAALARATEPRFSWDAVTSQFGEVLDAAATERQYVPLGLKARAR